MIQTRATRCLPLLLLVGCLASVGALPSQAQETKERRYTWVTTLDMKKMTRQRDGAVLFLLPINSDLQKVSYQVTGATRTEKLSLTHNDLLRITPAQRFVDVELTCVTLAPAPEATVQERLKHAQPGWEVPLPEDARKYLKRTEGLDQTTPGIKTLAKQLRGADRLQTALAIANYVNKTIKYDYQYYPTVDDILVHGTTQCEGMAATAVALMRQLEIPARMQFKQDGVTKRDGTPGRLTGHTVVDFYLPGAGWITIDPSAKPTPLNGVTFSIGEEPIPYYFLRTGMGALLKDGQTLPQDYPAMWAYLQKPENKEELMVATASWDSVVADQYQATYTGPRPADSPQSDRMRAIERQIEGTDWEWGKAVMTFGPHGSLRAGAQSYGTWRICDDMGVEMSWGKGMTYRIAFHFDTGTYETRGVDNTGAGGGKRVQP